VAELGHEFATALGLPIVEVVSPDGRLHDAREAAATKLAGVSTLRNTRDSIRRTFCRCAVRFATIAP
jgi:hypothetical protein